MAKRALIFWGGWDGHEPGLVADLVAGLLREESFDVQVVDSQEALGDAEGLAKLDLIVPIWTMGEIDPQFRTNVCRAVAEHGVGVGGCHGGMCDAFRTDTEWQFLTGGQWVAHPGNDGVAYTVNIRRDNPHPITEGLPDFEVVSEQYYLHTDPSNNVLATTRFPNPALDGQAVNLLVNPCDMPQVWTRRYGQGRIFYTALGHHRDVLEAEIPKEILRRGLAWAAR